MLPTFKTKKSSMSSQCWGYILKRFLGCLPVWLQFSSRDTTGVWGELQTSVCFLNLAATVLWIPELRKRPIKPAHPWPEHVILCLVCLLMKVNNLLPCCNILWLNPIFLWLKLQRPLNLMRIWILFTTLLCLGATRLSDI